MQKLIGVFAGISKKVFRLLVEQQCSTVLAEGP